MRKPTSIDGIRNGHHVITTVSGQPGQLAISRQHHPNCPCQTRGNQSVRIARRRKPTSPAAA
ncbi:hypothetical protein [Streptomyces resistomycificus]|uniref:Uncharacterized protein n=1 Tax=Streptomyces resistomycificus TaxID=67356 RepID=A0A0L8L5I3_9ACTN|nr:hypothetical protein [Streptomyces resistomycificus]KOG33331.1 hypothetical protein ADK37_23435 [Streptomyces resistomycificus]KUN99541.1 hypothetical protein AQJ84_11375 [Streptomyces resistomycificus]